MALALGDELSENKSQMMSFFHFDTELILFSQAMQTQYHCKNNVLFCFIFLRFRFFCVNIWTSHKAVASVVLIYEEHIFTTLWPLWNLEVFGTELAVLAETLSYVLRSAHAQSAFDPESISIKVDCNIVMGKTLVTASKLQRFTFTWSKSVKG